MSTFIILKNYIDGAEARKKVLVFTEKYLSISETFIYNQVCALEKQLDVQVVCIEPQNNDVYPTQNIICT